MPDNENYCFTCYGSGQVDGVRYEDLKPVYEKVTCPACGGTGER